jgi:hypothetical protein
VPDAVEAVCLRALAVDPRSRFATVGELWAALSAARRSGAATTMQPAVPSMATRPTAAGAPSGVPTARSPTAQMPASVAAASLPRSTSLPMSVPVHSAAGAVSRGTALPPSSVYGPSQPPFAAPPFVPPQAFPPPAAPLLGPPPGTAPPGQTPRRPFVPAEGTSPVVIVTIIAFVLTVLLAGSCALVHGACNAAAGG